VVLFEVLAATVGKNGDQQAARPGRGKISPGRRGMALWRLNSLQRRRQGDDYSYWLGDGLTNLGRIDLDDGLPIPYRS